MTATASVTNFRGARLAAAGSRRVTADVTSLLTKVFLFVSSQWRTGSSFLESFRKDHPFVLLTALKAKREELLQFVQTAISGLKVNADLMRMPTSMMTLLK